MPPTVPELVTTYRNLKPELAIANWERDWRRHCVSPTVTEVIDDTGQRVALQSPQGRVVAIYCRVSTVQQRGLDRDDGYSIAYQLEHGIAAAVKNRLAFRIYSDAGLSGFLMTNDEALKREVREAQAKLYEQIYTEVLLRGAESWNTPRQVADMRTFLAERTAAIRTGEKEPLVEERPDDHNDPRIEEVLIRRYQNHHKHAAFRPALHALTEDMAGIHAVYLTDPDRLSRSQILFVTLGRLFRSSETQVLTAAGEAAWLTGSDLQSQILAVVLPHEAERKLKDVKLGVLRGLLTMLRQGKPHSLLPFWLERDRKGYARLVPERLPVVYRLLEVALREDEHYGIARIAQELSRLGVPSPQGKEWHGDTVGYTLRNPWLFGCQVILGREWPMQTGDGAAPHPSPLIPEGNRDPERPLALITKGQFVRMHERRQARYPNAAGRPTPDKRLLSGLLVCQCGYAMVYRKAHPPKHTPACYRCHAPTLERRKTRAAGIVHTVLRPDEVDTFFTDLVADYADLLTVQQSAPAVSLDEQEGIIRGEMEREQHAKEAQAEQVLLSQGIREDTPEFQAAAQALARALLGEQFEAHQQALRRIERQRELELAAAKLKNAQERVADFRHLPSGEQNKILRNLIRKVVVKGEPGLEYLEIVLHEGEEETLPRIFLRTKVHRDGSLHRHLPTVTEWLSTWQAAPAPGP